MTKQQIAELKEEIRLLADQADNFVAGSQMQLPASMHAECLSGGMAAMSTKLHAIYEKIEHEVSS